MELSKQQLYTLSRIANGNPVFQSENGAFHWGKIAGGKVCTAQIKPLLDAGFVRIFRIKGGEILRCDVTQTGIKYLRGY